jgi:pimeloyl-ACP methyl ester carboxylesterase
VPFFTAPDGIRLHYEVEGSGPPVILHIGAGGDIELWRAAGYIEPLAKTNTCILFDHRGHGKSDHPATVAANHIDRYADDLAALGTHLGLPRVSYFGWSAGVVVGVRAAERHPGLFDAMVLMGGIGSRLTTEEMEANAKWRIPELESKGWWSLLEPMRASEKFPVPQWFFDRIVATDLEPYKAWIKGRPNWNWGPWDALPKIKTPTLLIAGELEDPDDVDSKAVAVMPDASRVRVPDRQHINAFLYSEFVAPLVLDFLASRRARSVVAGEAT